MIMMETKTTLKIITSIWITQRWNQSVEGQAFIGPVWEQWAKKYSFCLGDKLQFSYDNRLAVYFILNLVRPPCAQAYRNLEKVNVCKARRVDKSGSEKAVRPYTQTAISKN